MAISKTLQELRDETLQRADMADSSQLVPTAELDNYIRKGLMNMLDLIIDNGGEDYVSQVETTFTTNAAGRIPLSANAYRIMSVWRPDGAKRWRVLPASKAEIDILYRTQWQPQLVRFRLSGGITSGALSAGNMGIDFLPAPPTGTPYIIREILTPQLPTLGSDTWTFPNGWEEYATLDAAIRCISKEEGDTSELRNERTEMMQKIIAACQKEDTRWPKKVEDVLSYNDEDDFLRQGWVY